ncbi:MAG TPA: Wzz/FepE/Etk N-terminal domain-containing protein [Streptosporangiaceae bacterium]|jgi:capsular polysaccharide biosynthesis protein
MATPSHPEAFELADYLRVLRRRWWIVVTFTCLGLLAAAAYLVATPKTYTATAAVFVNANAASATQLLGSRTSGLAVNMDNEAQVVQSTPVAVPAAKAMRATESPAELVEHVTVAVPANTTVLQISCAGASPRWAAACAEAFASSYLSRREALAKGKVTFEIQQLEQRERDALTSIITLRKKITETPPQGAQRTLLRSEVSGKKAELLQLRGDVSALSGSVNYNPGYVLTPAAAPQSPSSPKPLLVLPSGLLAGLLIGLLAAFIADRRDHHIHAARDLERFLDLPVLFNLPRYRPDSQPALITPRSEAGQAFTALAEAVASGLGDGNHVLFIAASSPGRGAGIVAANLAAALARVRSDVLLVCADQHSAYTLRLLGVEDGRGLSDLLTGSARLTEAAHPVAKIARLRVIPPGTASAVISELDYGDSQRLVADLRRVVRYVIILAQAAGTGLDAFALAEFSDAALVVAETSGTKRDDVLNCVARLDRLRTPVLGAAMLSAGHLPRSVARSMAAPPSVGAGRGQPELAASDRGGPLPPSLEQALQSRDAAALPAQAVRTRKG